MHVTIETTHEDMEDAGFNPGTMKDIAEEALDESDPEMPGYNLDVVVVEEAPHTLVKVEASREELADCGFDGFDEESLRHAVAEALNEADPELPGYNVTLTVSE
ncbi:hypothetical protein [Halomonas sp. I5-271120]|uniref:hypothetical protein n=1 Tax=Halomonas sp. I5-271120 TaxID=3061632 RepID=UPI0027154A65|nr:hypothetical protein [Halomonas sp. I5-271120]